MTYTEVFKMGRIAKRLAKGTMSNSNATIYTVPALTTTTVVALSLCNDSASDVLVTLSFAGTKIMATHTIGAYDTLTIPFKDSPQLIETAELIEGFADTTSVINYYISGVEEV